jgi:FlaG/FlaF family flagellin (archaellin)
MEYNSGSKPSLGKSTGIEGVYISSLKSNNYESANNKTIDVVFQPNGDSYNAIVDYEIGYDISNLEHNDNSMNIASDYESETEKTYDIFDIGENRINQFFIGSITVIGLFMLYRMMQKHR